MIPLALLALGGVALVAGWLLLRSLGPGARIGRILAATRIVPVAEAARIATAGAARYVGVSGRIDAENEFEDEHGRPLVYRRARLEAADGRRWRVLDDHRELIPFEISEGLDRILVDGNALDDGVVVVRRESIGTAREIPDRVPEGLDPATRVRLRVEILSSVDHAVVLGVPAIDQSGTPILRAGLGRPLVITTLEPAEAMRLLAVDHRRRTIGATALLGSGVGLLALGVIAWVIDALI